MGKSKQIGKGKDKLYAFTNNMILCKWKQKDSETIRIDSRIQQNSRMKNKTQKSIAHFYANHVLAEKKLARRSNSS